VTSDASALILAGGKATRFGGIAKHELVIDGEPILVRQARALAPQVDEILVSAPTDVAGYRTVRDVLPGVGPLAGIAAGLAAMTTPWLVVVACDMPYITGELIEAMLALRSDSIDAVCVRVRELPEPVVCVLHERARAAVERRLAAGQFKASGVFTDEGLRIAWLDDPDPRALVNINSAADLHEI
jgi:molybdenum cofactor guanylyltransferase